MAMHPFPGRFPDTRPRRLRRHEWLRRAVAETSLSSADLVWPLFVHDHEAAFPVASMPGVERLPIEGVLRAADEAVKLGIPALALFPVVESGHKSDDAAHAFDPENLACRTVRALRTAFGDAIGIVCDSWTARSPTTRRSRCSADRRWPSPPPAATWSRPPT
jgi:porphobilinogen synthase